MQKSRYNYECRKCGKCCKVLEVVLLEEDILKWKKTKRDLYLNFIEICPMTFSTVKLKEMEEEKRNKVVSFILANHEYGGEGNGFPIRNSYFNQNWGSRPILKPKSFDIMIQGMQLGLEYILLNEFHKKCPFLKKHLCAINDSKPFFCSLFPYDINKELRLEPFILNLCKGIKGLNQEI